MSPKKGVFLAIFDHFSKFFIFLKEKRTFYATKRFLSIIYSIISFKRNRNEVNRTFLSLSNNYHAPMSPKPNQEPEVCHNYKSIQLYICKLYNYYNYTTIQLYNYTCTLLYNYTTIQLYTYITSSHLVRRTTWIHKGQDMRDQNQILTNLNMKNGQNSDLNM